MRTLISGIGYRHLRDFSIGPGLIPVLEDLDWPDGVEIHDLHFGPVQIVHWLEAQTPPFDRAIFIGAEPRGRAPGTIHRYRWTGELPDRDLIHAHVVEAVSGVISLENLLIVAQQFRALPADVTVIEVEPHDMHWGDEFSPPVEAAFDQIVREIQLAVGERSHE